MPILKFYPNGGSAGTPPGMNSHTRAKRGKVQGWTQRAARNQRNFFFSVDIGELSGHGVSCSLTLKDCPPTPSDFHRLRTNLIKRLSRAGLIRGHWLIEWQRRGVPHLHGCFYFDKPGAENLVRWTWLELAQQYGAGVYGQDVKPIYEACGWLQYLAKHGARGVNHYQRSNDNVPKQWTESTGRLWGKVGDWPIREPMKFRLGRDGFWAYRRLVKRYCLANARAEKNGYQVSFLRRMLSCNNRALSEVRGIADWMPLDVSVQLVVWLGSQDYKVNQVFE